MRRRSVRKRMRKFMIINHDSVNGAKLEVVTSSFEDGHQGLSAQPTRYCRPVYSTLDQQMNGDHITSLNNEISENADTLIDATTFFTRRQQNNLKECTTWHTYQVDQERSKSPEIVAAAALW